MYFVQRLAMSALFLVSFLSISGSDEIFEKAVVSRLADEKIEQLQHSFEAKFASNDRIIGVLKYGVLPITLVCSAYVIQNKIYWIGDTLIGTANWCWSGAKGLTGFGGSEAPEQLAAQAMAKSVEIVNIPKEHEDCLVRLAVIFKSLSKEDLKKLLCNFKYLDELNSSFLERLRLSCINKASLLTSFTSMLLGAFGKDYVSAQLSAIMGTQNLKHFVVGGTSLVQTKVDIGKRLKKLDKPIGRSTIEHMRERIYELSEKIQSDAMCIIAFMQAVNAYNNLEIESISMQTRMLIDEANDMASFIEYKLDEYGHTVYTDLTKRQDVLKEMAQKMLDFILLLEAEKDSFCILANQ